MKHAMQGISTLQCRQLILKNTRSAPVFRTYISKIILMSGSIIPTKRCRKKITKTLDFYETMVEIERKMHFCYAKAKSISPTVDVYIKSFDKRYAFKSKRSESISFSLLSRFSIEFSVSTNFK